MVEAARRVDPNARFSDFVCVREETAARTRLRYFLNGAAPATAEAGAGPGSALALVPADPPKWVAPVSELGELNWCADPPRRPRVRQ